MEIKPVNKCIDISLVADDINAVVRLMEQEDKANAFDAPWFKGDACTTNG